MTSEIFEFKHGIIQVQLHIRIFTTSEHAKGSYWATIHTRQDNEDDEVHCH